MRERASFPLVVAALACCGGPADAGSPESRRAAMVRTLARHGIDDADVLAAMCAVPRDEFVPAALRGQAYADRALPIGEGQTISQPYVVALMTQALQLEPGDKVLEIGTGSGYQAAVLSELVGRVWSIEIVEPLGRAARERLRRLGYDVEVRIGDGYRGWPEQAPFDAILVTAAPDHVPAPLVEQLAPGGRMILPVGERTQQLRLLEKTEAGLVERRLLDVLFVPMTGEAQRK